MTDQAKEITSSEEFEAIANEQGYTVVYDRIQGKLRAFADFRLKGTYDFVTSKGTIEQVSPRVAFLQEHDRSGYVLEEDLALVLDAGNEWVIVVEDAAEGGYMVGRFSKPTISGAGDFVQGPLAEGMERKEAVAFAKGYVAALNK